MKKCGYLKNCILLFLSAAIWLLSAGIPGSFGGVPKNGASMQGGAKPVIEEASVDEMTFGLVGLKRIAKSSGSISPLGSTSRARSGEASRLLLWFAVLVFLVGAVRSYLSGIKSFTAFFRPNSLLVADYVHALDGLK